MSALVLAAAGCRDPLPRARRCRSPQVASLARDLARARGGGQRLARPRRGRPRRPRCASCARRSPAASLLVVGGDGRPAGAPGHRRRARACATSTPGAAGSRPGLPVGRPMTGRHAADMTAVIPRLGSRRGLRRETPHSRRPDELDRRADPDRGHPAAWAPAPTARPTCSPRSTRSPTGESLVVVNDHMPNGLRAALRGAAAGRLRLDGARGRARGLPGRDHHDRLNGVPAALRAGREGLIIRGDGLRRGAAPQQHAVPEPLRRGPEEARRACRSRGPTRRARRSSPRATRRTSSSRSRAAGSRS